MVLAESVASMRSHSSEAAITPFGLLDSAKNAFSFEGDNLDGFSRKDRLKMGMTPLRNHRISLSVMSIMTKRPGLVALPRPEISS